MAVPITLSKGSQSEYGLLRTRTYDRVGSAPEQIELRDRRAKLVHSVAVNERREEIWSEARVANELKKTDNNLGRFSDDWNL